MRLNVDLDTLAISNYRNAVVRTLTARRSDRFPVQVRFRQDGVVKELPHGTMGRIVIKKTADFSGFPVAWSPGWRKVGYGAGAYYVFQLNLHTQQIVDQFLSLQGELASVTLAFEIQWEKRGQRRSTKALPITIENDYVRLEDESEPPVAIVDPLPPEPPL